MIGLITLAQLSNYIQVQQARYVCKKHFKIKFLHNPYRQGSLKYDAYVLCARELLEKGN